jgi:hypothetical protein
MNTHNITINKGIYRYILLLGRVFVYFDYTHTTKKYFDMCVCVERERGMLRCLTGTRWNKEEPVVPFHNS